MFACSDCLDCGLEAPSFLGSRWAPRLRDDPLWDSIRAEARVEADREPLLRHQLESLLEHRSFGDALGAVLGNRLADTAPGAMIREFQSVIESEPAIESAARQDLTAIRERDPAVRSLLHPLLNFKGFLAVSSQRIAHALWQDGRSALSYHLQNRASERFGADIHPAAKIGAGVFLDHATGVVIGETATVGDNVTLLHGVTLGGTGKTSGDRHPKVGDEVFIGAGAQLLGNIRIGEGARIGAGSVVLNDVPPQATAVGVPAKLVNRSQPLRTIA